MMCTKIKTGNDYIFGIFVISCFVRMGHSANLTDVDTRNTTKHREPVIDEDIGISWDDATWILTSAFIIFTMQSGKKQLALCS